jgi:hypothetical protein
MLAACSNPGNGCQSGGAGIVEDGFALFCGPPTPDAGEGATSRRRALSSSKVVKL